MKSLSSDLAQGFRSFCLLPLLTLVVLVSTQILLTEAAFSKSDENNAVFNGEPSCGSDKLFQQTYLPQIRKIEPDLIRIREFVMQNSTEKGKTYDELARFVDKFGSRLTGTKNLENAIDYMLDRVQKDGHQNVRGEAVQIPVWHRGTEWVQLLKPLPKNLTILGLGSSEGTNGKTLEAEAIVVQDFAELERRSKEAAGKIVIYNFKFISYGESVKYRLSGAARAAQHGAIAALVRSVTGYSINSPHAGNNEYEANITKIPAISITVEDSEMFGRMAARGDKIVLKIYSENHLNALTGISRNVVSEVVGSQNPEQVVLVSGHIDSWDVGQGAMDDGGGAFISWRSLSVLNKLGLKPKRTVRSVLWTGEELGLIGAKQYAKQHAAELNNHVVAMESDIGTFDPLGVTYSGPNLTSHCVIWEILKLLEPIKATRLRLAEDGSDTEMLISKGVPITSLDNHSEDYFNFHHTNGDMMTVESADSLDKCLALWTVVSYGIAALDQPLPR